MARNYLSTVRYDRNVGLYLTTRTAALSAAGTPVLGAGTLASAEPPGALALASDYDVYASAAASDGVTVLLAPTAATWEVAGGWTYLMTAYPLLTGQNGDFFAWLKVYQKGFSDAAHEVAEWKFVLKDTGA